MEEQSKTVAVAEIQGSIDLTDICSSTCPFLASKFDGVTPMAYPHANNQCYRHGEPIEKTIQVQREYCLSPAYDSCPVYLETEKPKSDVHVNERKSKNFRERRLAIPLTAFILLLLFVALVSWPVLAQPPGQDRAANLPYAIEQLWGLLEGSDQADQPAAVEVEEANPVSNPGQTIPDAGSSQPARQADGDFRAIQYPPG